MDEKIEKIAEVNTAKRIENYFSSFEITPGLTKLLCAFTASTFLGFGIRSALKHTRVLKSAEYSQAKINSGVNFASRALVVTTVITVSSYALFVISISVLLDVNTPRQFGEKMQQIFGNRFRLEKKESVPSFREVIRKAEKSEK